jgi:DNA-directed RNA polymerase subunit RPC12/RpoP
METPKRNNDYYAAISIKDSSKPTDVYFCSWCSRKLFFKEQDEETGKLIWWCSFCSHEIIPDNQLTKQKSTLKTPGPDVDNSGNVIGNDDNNNTIPIAVIDDPNKELSSTTFKNVKLPAAYEALRRQGFRWTSFEER